MLVFDADGITRECGPMAEVVLFTGFPGFLGKRIAQKVLAEPDVMEVFFLVQEHFRRQAEEALSRYVVAERAKARLVTGDIAARGLGLDRSLHDGLKARVTRAYHLAAAYSLALPRDVGMRVNVSGTRNVLDFLEGAPRFEKLAYVSTCAVSGDHVGVFTEDDFDVRQGFKNFYEETKYLAEGEVRSRWGRIPTVIFRPSVVVGDSKTGEAEKIDGPYYTFFLVKRGLTRIAAQSSGKFHLVPVDFVVDGLTTIFARKESIGRVFALADPAPLTFDEFFDAASDAFGKPRPLFRLPARFWKPVFYAPGMAKLTGIPAQSFDYSVFPVDWVCPNTMRALEGTDLRCPRLTDYLPTLAKYFNEHMLDKAGRW
jgi:thioester reductase-like protein